MKELIVILGGIFFYQALIAQTWSEWFRQNHTQLVYLQEQIAALQALQVTQQSGYVVSENGLETIDTTAIADYDQHSAHFIYLQRASPGVLNDPRIAEIDTFCVRTLLVADAIEALGPLRSGRGLDWEALSHSIAGAIDDSVNEVTSRLAIVLTADLLQMSDAEREKTLYLLQIKAHGIYAQASAAFKEFTEKTILP
ncbi:MAG TPA: hypothetical protein VGS79_00360 [Puia sp.]|nr:hypothetical protein [Puia sp.]